METGIGTETRGDSRRRWQLLSFGDPCADIVIAAGEPPALGEKVLGRALGTLAGGTTANVACGVARLDMRCAVFGRTGADANGDVLRDSFARFGVDMTYLRREQGAASASAIVIVTPSGEKSVIYQPMETAPLDRPALAEALAESRVAYAMPYDLEEYAALSATARERGALVAIDLEAAVAPGPDAMRARAALADIVFFNESGFEAGNAGAVSFDAMRAVLALGPRVVVVSLGAAGAMAVSAGEEASRPAFAARVVDTAGAGDSFNAAFLSAWLDGAALDACLRFACAAASCTVAAMGARTALPDRARVASVLSEGAA
jgi:sugar/nucleoside kinase (ribokinase family)